MKLPVHAPMVGLRLHSRSAPSPASQSAGVGAPLGAPTPPPTSDDFGSAQWLLDLKDKAEQERDAAHATMRCIGSLVGAVEPIPAMVASRLDEIGGMVTEMALAVAREIVGEALDRGIVDPTSTVQRCLRDCVQGADASALSVSLSPNDFGSVLENLQRDPASAASLSNVDFQSDPGLGRGEVVVRTGSGMLHYDPAEVMDRLCDAVRHEVQA